MTLHLLYNNLDKSIRNSESLRIFKKSVLKFLRPSLNGTYNCFNTRGIKHFTRLCLGLSHLRDHKFKHGFLNALHPVWSCGLDIETTCQFSLRPPNFLNKRSIFLSHVSKLTKYKLHSCGASAITLLFYGYDSLHLVSNTLKCSW